VEIKMNLFQKVNITLHSGGKSDFKIECDALTDTDFKTIAHLISKKYSPIISVYGIPTGGRKLEQFLKDYTVDTKKGYILIVDDVLTTGNSMEQFRKEIIPTTHLDICKGVVIFARGKCPDWIEPIFQMWEN
jgi:hypothetical protein